MAKSPAFQFYPQDWLSSPRITMMTLEEEGAYIRLLCFDWMNDGIPDDEQSFLSLSGLNKRSTNVQQCFIEHPTKPNYITNERLLVERNKQLNRRKKCSEAGKASGLSRSKSITSNGRSTSVEQKSNSSLSSSSSISSSNNKKSIRFTPPSLSEVQEYISLKSYSVDAENFINFYESKGWMVGKNKMKSWKASISTWQKREQTPRKPNAKSNRNTESNQRAANEAVEKGSYRALVISPENPRDER